MKTDEIASVFEIVSILRGKEPDVQKAKNKRTNKLLLVYIAILIIILIASILAALVVPKEAVKFYSFCLFAVAYFGLILTPIFELCLHWKSFFQLIKKPSNFLHQKATDIAIAELSEVAALKGESLQALQYVKIQLSHHTNSMLKRVSLLVGAIEKVGVVPSLIGLAVGLAHFKTSYDFEYALVLAYCLPIWHLLGIALHSYGHNVDKVLDLLDFVIEQKQAESQR